MERLAAAVGHLQQGRRCPIGGGNGGGWAGQAGASPLEAAGCATVYSMAGCRLPHLRRPLAAPRSRRFSTFCGARNLFYRSVGLEGLACGQWRPNLITWGFRHSRSGVSGRPALPPSLESAAG